MLNAIPALLLALPLGPVEEERAPFPVSTAIAEEVSPASLAGLASLVRGLVDEGEVVGAELMVLKNGKKILHEAYGFADRESEKPMEVGSVFCVRSMTKPVVGTAVLMLIDEGKLDLDDRVAEYLPSFDALSTGSITVEQLLTHTSGLPMSLILGKDLQELASMGGIRGVADLGGGYADLLFPPGSDFHYSDQGTDTLTALVEIVSGMPAADFVRERILDPLEMSQTTCVMTEGHPLRAKALSKYVGSTNSWARFWSPADPPLFPFFLGSQGLYSTLEDYARFLQFWENKGRIGRERALASRYFRKALTPGQHPFQSPTGLPDLRCDYGYLMQLWTEEGEEPGEREVVVYGHTGSDGTHAWVFPEQDAMVLYFTQSRNNPTGLRVEEALGDLLLGVPYDPAQDAPPLEEYLGYYWEGEGDLYRAIVRDGDDLALEIMGKAVVPLTYVGDDRWKLRPDPRQVLAFQRDATGHVTGYRVGDHEEFRFEPAEDLPDADELAQRVATTHRIDLLESLGPLRLQSELEMEKMGMSGETTLSLSWPDRFRIETDMAGNFEHITFDGTHAQYESTTQAASNLEGTYAEQTRLGSALVRLGDWRRFYGHLEVIQRLVRSGEDIYLVRAGDTSAPGRNYYVHAETARLVRDESVVFVDGVGRLGQRMDFQDYRDVSGMLIPFRTEIELANPLIGPIVSTVVEVDVGVELAPDAFRLLD